MPRDGKQTRNKILRHSKELVFERGFSGMSIDMILQRTGISKGTFLYHFKTKNGLARGLMDQYIEHDDRDRSEALQLVHGIKDPLDRLLAFVQVFIDEFEKLKAPFSGCLYASYIYEPEQFTDEILQDISSAFHRWRTTIEEMIDEIYELYEPAIKVDKTALAFHLSIIFEGAFVLSKAVNDSQMTANQLKQYKNYIELLFRK